MDSGRTIGPHNITILALPTEGPVSTNPVEATSPHPSITWVYSVVTSNSFVDVLPAALGPSPTLVSGPLQVVLANCPLDIPELASNQSAVTALPKPSVSVRASTLAFAPSRPPNR